MYLASSFDRCEAIVAAWAHVDERSKSFCCLLGNAVGLTCVEAGCVQVFDADGAPYKSSPY